MGVKSYTFRVVVEPDEDAWHAYCPALVRLGGATWGKTKEEAVKNIQEVIEMIVEELIEEGEPIPAEAATVSQEPLVTVTR
jgi:predicted RNase H-like HicB family nuclease